jgi:Domain of unknown function (DUF4349)
MKFGAKALIWTRPKAAEKSFLCSATSLPALLIVFSVALSACSDQASVAKRAVPEAASQSAAVGSNPSDGIAMKGAVGKPEAAGLSRGAAPAQAGDASSSSSAEVTRYIALRHSLTLETPAEKLKSVYEGLIKRCLPTQCELLVANYSRETDGNLPSASLEMRIQPKLADGYIASLSQEAEVLVHNRGSEDRTDQVIDVEAQMKNITQLRDQLRAMLSEKRGTLKETLDVQRELANTQSRLDALTGTRKALANETEKVAVSVALQAKRTSLPRQVWSPLNDAWHGVGEVMASSLAFIITFAAAILPWLIVGLPLLWLVRHFWKRHRA